MTITVRYSCDCGIDDMALDVPARTTEDVGAWMQQTMLTISRDHHRRSPHCTAHRLRHLKIPMTGTDKVGGPTVQ